MASAGRRHLRPHLEILLGVCRVFREELGAAPPGRSAPPELSRWRRPRSPRNPTETELRADSAATSGPREGQALQSSCEEKEDALRLTCFFGYQRRDGPQKGSGHGGRSMHWRHAPGLRPEERSLLKALSY